MVFQFKVVVWIHDNDHAGISLTVDSSRFQAANVASKNTLAVRRHGGGSFYDVALLSQPQVWVRVGG